MSKQTRVARLLEHLRGGPLDSAELGRRAGLPSYAVAAALHGPRRDGRVLAAYRRAADSRRVVLEWRLPAARSDVSLVLPAGAAAAVAAWLEAKAAELEGKTLYHPEHALRAWAAELRGEEPK